MAARLTASSMCQPLPRRLLIIACGKTKREGVWQAIELYDGPLYRILRKAMREGKQVEVWILSAEYGLIPAEQEIACYDRRMDRERAYELAPAIRVTLQGVGSVEEVYIECGRDYLPALPGKESLMEVLGCRLAWYGRGPIGKRGSQLKSWLAGGRCKVEDNVFGLRVLELRLGAGLTQTTLARALQVDHTYICKIERGMLPQPPSEALIRQMAGVLGADEEELLDLAGKFSAVALRQAAQRLPRLGRLLRVLQRKGLTEVQVRTMLEIAQGGPGPESTVRAG